jgi:alcohol dehydrogenase
MRQLHFIKPGQFEWRDVLAPTLQSDRDAIVRPLSVARCDLDMYIATGAAPAKGPFPFGHEVIAEVVDPGPASTFTPGDRVIVPFQLSCGTCSTCRRGFTASCEAYPPRAAFGLGMDFGGGLSERMRVPFADHMLMRAPGGFTPLQLASMPDNLPDGWRAVAPHLKARPGANVLVTGGLAQSVGLYAAGLAVSLGAGRVVYLDDNADRCAAAERLGAVAASLALDAGREPTEQFDITVDASGSQQALQFSLRSTAPNGVCTAVAIYFEPLVGLPLTSLYMKGITFHTSRVSARATLPDLIDHVVCGHFCPEMMVTRVVPFAQAAEAMDAPDIKIVFETDLGG